MLIPERNILRKNYLKRALVARPHADPHTNATFDGEALIAPKHTLKRASEDGPGSARVQDSIIEDLQKSLLSIVFMFVKNLPMQHL